MSRISVDILGLYFYTLPLQSNLQKPLTIGLIQGNIPNEVKFNSDGWLKAIQGYEKGYQFLANQSVDVVLTPETAFPFLANTFLTPNHSFYQTIQKRGVPVWLGLYTIYHRHAFSLSSSLPLSLL